MAMQPLALEAIGAPHGAGRGVSRGLRRPATVLVVAILALIVAGDRGRAAGIPAAVYGQDPLEVLELKVRPNVIVVLDSSGSMTETLDLGSGTGLNTSSGDHPRSKLYQAKQVLRQVVQNNQDKISLQFGTYTQFNMDFNGQAAGNNRFQYATTSQLSPSMTTTELTVQGATGDTLGRGLQSWQVLYPRWGTLYFEEDANGSGSVDASVCAASLTGLPKFYVRGGSGAVSPALSTSTTPENLSYELQTAMNTATCATGTRQNTYSVTYNTGTGVFTFARNAGPQRWRILWAQTPNNIRNALAETTASTTAWQTTGSVPTDAPWTLLYRSTTGSYNLGSGSAVNYKFTETVSSAAVTDYQMRASRLWNGEVIRVQSNGAVCGMTFPTAAEKTSPPTITLQLVATGCGADQTDRVTFQFGGGDFSGNDSACRGFRSKSDLIPCDLQSPPAPSQFTMISPYIEPEFPFTTAGDPVDLTTNGAAYGTAAYGVPDGIPDYVEVQDGSWAVSSFNMAPSAKADGTTPIANTLIDIKGVPDSSGQCLTNAPPPAGKLESVVPAGTAGACTQRGFSKLWSVGQTGATTMAGPAPWQLSPIKDHGLCADGTTACAANLRKPKEKTIVLFVTDGDDTCLVRGSGGSSAVMDDNARRAAYWAEKLYKPIDPADSASSVPTYVIGFGGAFSLGEPYRLNWIAWGGSGLGQGLTGQPNVPVMNGADDPPDPAGTVRWNETATNLTSLRAQCTTCVDAFVAPDAATLATQLQGIIDQGASEGDFNAQQSITESIFEYVELASTGTTTYDAAIPANRYKAIVPTRFVSSFSLPGFRGQLKAFQNNGAGVSVQKWSAGDVLRTKVSTAMATCPALTTAGKLAGECVISELHGGATDANIRTSTAKIKRRIYTTDRNGVYPYTPDSLMDPKGFVGNRVALWPPQTGVLPVYTSLTDVASKPYDVAMGLPPDVPTSFPPNPVEAKCDPADTRPIANPKYGYDQCWFNWLGKRFGACVGPAATLPAACTAMSGAVADYPTRLKFARREAREIALAFMAGAAVIPDTTGIKRTSGTASGAPAGSLLYKARSWILGDSELATAAVVTPPLPAEPTATPYVTQYQLFRDGPRAGTANADTNGDMIRAGFGLRNPDTDKTVGVDDARPRLKPVMTVVYAPANDMLHAFRAAPCYSALAPTSCLNGTESGGEELWGFVPYDQLGAVMLRAANEPQGKSNHVYMLARGVRFADVFVPGSYTRSFSGMDASSTVGMWRRILFFGRGIGGKYMTALDVTAPGPYTEASLETNPPVPLWSRGNPDTQNGLAGGTPNGTATDGTAYLKMGETWSIPVVAYVDNTIPIYNGRDYVLFMGSGYGNAGEGTTFYTLDALTGNVLATADVGSRTGFTAYRNALPANAVGFNPKVFSLLTTVHPAASQVTRLYIGDLHGRLWKFLTARPDVALPVADLGADQPVGTAASLLGMPPQPSAPIPYVFVTSGNDRRAAGPFRSFAFRDDGTDTDTAIGAASTDDGVTTYLPAAKLYARTFDQGDPLANCGYPTEAVFRGTVQPATAFECSSISGGTCSNPIGRVFFVGTRLSLPNTKFAPPTPLSCSLGVYPCRSQFDSIIYALGALTGLPAYDLNSTGDDAYRIFRDSRIAALTVQADPDPARGGSSVTPDEGLMKGTPKPPPPPGVPPTATSATANVLMVREPGQPAPAIRYGSTVCQ